MKHGYFGKKLSRSSNERTQLRRNLLRSLVVHGTMKTTVTKAKAIQGDMDRLITTAKKGTEFSKRQLFAELAHKKAIEALQARVSNQFAQRTSGYTRIVKIGPRRGDNAEMVILSFVDAPIVADAGTEKVTKTTKVAKTSEVKVSEKKNASVPVVDAEVIEESASKKKTKAPTKAKTPAKKVTKKVKGSA